VAGWRVQQSHMAGDVP